MVVTKTLAQKKRVQFYCKLSNFVIIHSANSRPSIHTELRLTMKIVLNECCEPEKQHNMKEMLPVLILN